MHHRFKKDSPSCGIERVRVLDGGYAAWVARGLLVPALTDWVVDEVPPVNLLYPPRVRRTPRVRVFLDWVVQLFAEVKRERLSVAIAATVHPFGTVGRRSPHGAGFAIFMLAVLIVRPTGMFGWRRIERV